MLDLATRDQVRATAPVLQQHGLALTRHFYTRLFQHNPELRELFNQGHQRGGTQQQALAAAVAAYALHIDQPAVLMPVLERVVAKHVSLGVRQEHYAIVGRHLLASIGEVLGAAATPALLQAWEAAYGQLAALLAGLEQNAYNAAAAQRGGWTGWRTFRLRARHAESAEITSFLLEPADGGALPEYLPGQYLSVRRVVPELGYRQPRQYSLSDAPGQDHLRISVKRETGRGGAPDGMVSGLLHASLQVGDTLEVAPPAGDFYLHTERTTPVVLISAGVGITPMMSMLETLAGQRSPRTLRFVHAARNASVLAFADRVRALVAELPDAAAWTVLEEAASAVRQGHEHGHEQGHRQGHASGHALGRLSLPALAQQGFLPADADYYVCGPAGFMREQISALRALGVAPDRIHAEAFGTGGVAG